MAEPIRTCISCGDKKKKRELQRFVWKDERPQADAAGCASGRGVYCCKTEICLEKFAKQKKKWKRLFRL